MREGSIIDTITLSPAGIRSVYTYTEVKGPMGYARHGKIDTDMSEEKTLYARLGGYDAIAAVANNLVSRLMTDGLLGRFWANRGEDGIKREIQLLIDFLCHSAGGPVLYTGRDMKTSHKGMRITEEDWAALILHLNATLDHFQVAAAEKEAVVGFVQSMKSDVVEGLRAESVSVS